MATSVKMTLYEQVDSTRLIFPSIWLPVDPLMIFSSQNIFEDIFYMSAHDYYKKILFQAIQCILSLMSESIFMRMCFSVRFWRGRALYCIHNEVHECQQCIWDNYIKHLTYSHQLNFFYTIVYYLSQKKSNWKILFWGESLLDCTNFC